jgi:NAD(P)-dependent dehydrogenase (short-subunit alcohol dehydrogenase family)
MDVRDLAAVVTGGHSGMGFAAARLLADKGARVTIFGRRPQLVKEKAAAIGALGITCDISDADAVDAALEQAERTHGIGRILINSAAIGTLYTLLNSDGSVAPLQNIRNQNEINVMGTLIMNRSFSSRLTCAEVLANGQRGVIINVSSIAPSDGCLGASYAASKGAVDAIALALARELDPWNIRVCTIAPGGIDTEMLHDGASPARFEMVKRLTPGIHRLGKPDEFAALALHICENDYLNGAYFRIDGGRRVPFNADVGVNSTARS